MVWKFIVSSTFTRDGTIPKMKGLWQPVRTRKYSPVKPSPNLPWKTADFTATFLPHTVTFPWSSRFKNFSSASGSPALPKPKSSASSGGTVSSQTKSQEFRREATHEAGRSPVLSLLSSDSLTASPVLGFPVIASLYSTTRSQMRMSRISPSNPPPPTCKWSKGFVVGILGMRVSIMPTLSPSRKISKVPEGDTVNRNFVNSPNVTIPPE
mmetsp:Transcript_108821/g.216098  ORF Transcript_108821/g.216098 Transcript_108821/m.216098 type:complete len:210 (-) Transcript_108821:654-1283(-)